MMKPLLKWVGGKRQLLPALRRFYPRDFGTYIEPFFGSGAVFFDLWQLGKLRHRRTVANLPGDVFEQGADSEGLGDVGELNQGPESDSIPPLMGLKAARPTS